MSFSRVFQAITISCLLIGCDSAKGPMAKAREAEAAGKLADAKALYADVCKANEGSPFCPVAKQHIDAITVREAMDLVEQGQYAKAKELSTSIGAQGAKAAYEELLKTKAVTAGLAFEEANTSADKAQAVMKMEELAAQSSPAAEKATEWLAKNAPALLLAEIKATCKADGKGACADLGKAMERQFQGSAEAGEAKPLVEAEYKRLYPILKQAEGLLVQRLEVYLWKVKYDLCLEQTLPAPGGGEGLVCKSEAGAPEDREDPFDTGFLEKAWKKKLDEINDTGLVKQLEDRWLKIESSGIYDAANWPKPGDKK